MDGERLGQRVDDPVMGDLAAMIDPQLLDGIVPRMVRREDLADPIGPDPDRGLVGQLGEVLAAPAADVGAVDLIGAELDLGRRGEPPAAGAVLAVHRDAAGRADDGAGRAGGVLLLPGCDGGVGLDSDERRRGRPGGERRDPLHGDPAHHGLPGPVRGPGRRRDDVLPGAQPGRRRGRRLRVQARAWKRIL